MHPPHQRLKRTGKIMIWFGSIRLLYETKFQFILIEFTVR
jgi:hypothetical protein